MKLDIYTTSLKYYKGKKYVKNMDSYLLWNKMVNEKTY